MSQSFWQQNYSIIAGSNIYTALLALLPIVFFLLALTVFKLKGHIAAGLTMVLAIIIAIFAYGMPASSAGSAAVYGILVGLWPIGWIVIWALFVYNVTVETGKFNVIRSFISKVSDDQRVQVLLIAFGFGVFLEGVAGFGIPIAIGAALLLGLGMRSAILAASVCLVANMGSAPSGAIGIPIIVASQVSGIDIHVLSTLISRQVGIVIFILPFWLVAMVDGFRGIKETLPLILVTSVVSTITALVVYYYLGPELADVILGIVAMVVIIGFSKVWKPKNTLTADGHVPAAEAKAAAAANENKEEYGFGQTLFAWSPFIAITAFALLWTAPAVKSALNTFTISFPMPNLHGAIAKGAPLLLTNAEGQPILEKAMYSWDIVKSVGTALFFSGLYTVIAFRVNAKTFAKVLTATVKQLLFPILTICFVLGFARVADYSGQTAAISIFLANTGQLFPLLAPLLGMLGVFLTGSVVNSNTLFAKVQVITAGQIGANASLLAASNTIGSIAGKVISPQSIAIGCAATKSQGREGELLAAVLKHAVIFIVFICFMTYAQQYWFPWTTVV